MSTWLKPCPFCGGRVTLVESSMGHGSPTIYFVECTNKRCMASTTFSVIRAAFQKKEREKAKMEFEELWNQRKEVNDDGVPNQARGPDQ